MPDLFFIKNTAGDDSVGGGNAIVSTKKKYKALN